MNLKEEILAEHSKRQANRIIKYVGDNKKRFNELLKLFLCNDPLLRQRSGWPLSYISAEHPHLITPHIKTLLKNLKQKDLHPAVLRNTVRIFHDIEIPEKNITEVYDICLHFLKNAILPHAVRVFSMYTLANICKRYPELKNEVELVLSELKSFPQSPSMIAAIKKTSKILLKL